MAASAAAEAAVKKLARLPSNTACPNCGTQKKFGFSTVCIKYLTFVCNNCKASHQAISHRCKSLTMSSWTEGEVLALKKAGNEKARATWLAKAPPPGQGGRPKEGDHIDVFKAFIVDVYERKRYFDEAGEGETTAPPPPPPSSNVKATSSPRRPHITPTPHNTVGAPAATPPAPAIADLLDFGAFGSTPAPAPPQQDQTFNAFGDFSSQPAPSAPPPSAFPPAPSALPPVPASSDLFGSQPVQQQQQQPLFDPFNASAPAPAEKPPSMKNVTGLANAPTPMMGMPPAQGMMPQTMGNGMMMGGQQPMMGGSQFMNNTPMMNPQNPQMAANNPQAMMMMNAQQQQMMMNQRMMNPNQMNMMSGNMFPQQQAWPGPTAMGNSNTSSMMSSMGSGMGGSTASFGSAPQMTQPKKKDPFSDLGL